MSFIDIGPKEIHDLINESPFTIFDMRDLNSFNNEHIPGSVPYNDFSMEQLIKRKNKSENVLVYCYLGNSSRDLSSFLSKFGYKNVYNLVGGYTAWRKYLSQNNSNLSNESNKNESSNDLSNWLTEKGFDARNLKDRI